MLLLPTFVTVNRYNNNYPNSKNDFKFNVLVYHFNRIRIKTVDLQIFRKLQWNRR